jgi:hypothetical protein
MIMTKIFLCIYIYIYRERERWCLLQQCTHFFEWNCPQAQGPRVALMQDGMMLIKQPGCPMRRFDESTSFVQRQTRSVGCNCSLSHTVSSKTEIGPSGLCTTSFAYQFWLNSSLLHRPVCSLWIRGRPKQIFVGNVFIYVVRCLNMFSVCGRLHRKQKKHLFATSVCITWKETSWCFLCQ